MNLKSLSEEIKDHTIKDENSFSRIDEKLDRILDQTTRHNGRLTKTEKTINMLIGGLIVVSMIIVPLFLNLIK